MYNITVFITRIVWAVYVELYNCEELVESISGRERHFIGEMAN